MSGAPFKITYGNITKKHRKNFEKSAKKIIRISNPSLEEHKREILLLSKALMIDI
jgi:hypothetical protein